MGTIKLEEPIKIGFPYELWITWPGSFLLPGDTVRAQLRQMPGAPLLATFAVTRENLADGRVRTKLKLTEQQTAVLEVSNVQSEPVIVSGLIELPVTLLLEFNVREHVTEATP